MIRTSFPTARLAGPLVLVGALLLTSCTDEPTPFQPPPTQQSRDLVRSSAGIDVPRDVMDQLLAELTRAVALALEEDGVRQRVYRDLDASDYPEGKRHLRTMLIDNAIGLGDAMQRHVEWHVESRLDSILDLEIYLPVDEHRAAWRGDAALVVASVLEDDGTVPQGFRLDGASIAMSADEPPATPMLAIVPVETDFTRPPSLAQPAFSMTTTPGVYMHLSQIPGDWEGFMMGDPEFEVHVFIDQGSGEMTDVTCSGSERGSPFHWDQDGINWSGTVLLASEATLGENDAVFQMWEDDSGACTSSGGRPPKTTSATFSDIATYSAKVVGIAALWTALPGGTFAWVKNITSTISQGTVIYDILQSVHKDDFVGFIQWPPLTCWPSATGSVYADIIDENDNDRGYVKLNNTFGVRDPICDLSVQISGPSEITMCDTWIIPDPQPDYQAVVSGGSGSTSYEWRADGQIASTSAWYTLQDLSQGQHTLELRVTKGVDQGGNVKIVNVNQDNCDGGGGGIGW